jgi:hypothetical protein
VLPQFAAVYHPAKHIGVVLLIPLAFCLVADESVLIHAFWVVGFLQVITTALNVCVCAYDVFFCPTALNVFSLER